MNKSILLLGLFVLFGCSSYSKKVQSDEPSDCTAYFDILATKWVKNKDGTYSYESYPKYWPPYANFFDGDCLIGKQRKKILSLLGTPSKTFFVRDTEVLIYCLDESCLYTGLNSNLGVNVVVSQETNRVIDAYHSPLKTESDH